jgi:hypothetical protein
MRMMPDYLRSAIGAFDAFVQDFDAMAERALSYEGEEVIVLRCVLKLTLPADVAKNVNREISRVRRRVRWSWLLG